jgi:adenosylcobinamide-phosphate synthase
VNAGIALLALLIERVFGYPAGLARILAHPVIWIGSLIGRLEAALNDAKLSAARRRRNGTLMLGLVLIVCGLPALALAIALRSSPFGWLLEALFATPWLAQKELGRSVQAVSDALDRSLVGGRKAVAEIVGRDTSELDRGGVARAAIESLAENTSDGVVAPVFWLLLLGLPGLVLYKAINTADSMVGHRDARYLEFGWASARLDDLVNLVPARLTALLFAFAAMFVGGSDGAAALRAAWRDAPRHVSPNAGWPEAAMAGALGFGLGGPKSYDGRRIDLPKMGDGRVPEPADIGRALQLYRVALLVLYVAVALIAFLLFR